MCVCGYISFYYFYIMPGLLCMYVCVCFMLMWSGCDDDGDNGDGDWCHKMC